MEALCEQNALSLAIAAMWLSLQAFMSPEVTPTCDIRNFLHVNVVEPFLEFHGTNKIYWFKSDPKMIRKQNEDERT